MPNTDLQYKDDLRKQRDDWQEIIEYLDNLSLIHISEPTRPY